MKILKKIIYVLFLILLITGQYQVIHPMLLNYDNKKSASEEIGQFTALHHPGMVSDENSSTEENDPSQEEDEKDEEGYEQVRQYNEDIFSDGQAGLVDAWSYENVPDKLTFLESDLIGYIESERMNVKLPLYLGASAKNLRKGAAILSQTSIPADMKNTNSVIAGHRGYCGIPFFRDIALLRQNDIVKITTRWDTLYYRVKKAEDSTGDEAGFVIEPDDMERVRIQEGKDMITLVSCTPYACHDPKLKKRYCVYCELDPDYKEENDTKATSVSDQVKNLPAKISDYAKTDSGKEILFDTGAYFLVLVLCVLTDAGVIFSIAGSLVRREKRKHK